MSIEVRALAFKMENLQVRDEEKRRQVPKASSSQSSVDGLGKDALGKDTQERGLQSKKEPTKKELKKIEGSATDEAILKSVEKFKKIQKEMGSFQRITREEADSYLKYEPLRTAIVRYSDKMKNWTISIKETESRNDHYSPIGDISTFLKAREPTHFLSSKEILEWPSILKLPFRGICDHASKDEILKKLSKTLKNYYKKHHEKLKIYIKKDLVFVGYTNQKLLSLMKLEECHFLEKCFYTKGCNTIFRNFYRSEYFKVYDTFNEMKSDEIILEKLRKKYASLSKVDGSKMEVCLPKFSSFKGNAHDVTKVFSSMLKGHKGIFVGEKHEEMISKDVLKDQMKTLYQQGVRTLFLEFCCYDTLQPELDEFFRTKKASAFLKAFLSFCCNLEINYFDLVQAAVNAGIRPVGLERKDELDLPNIGERNETKMLNLNVEAKEIIDKETKKNEGKYIALVGDAHLSFCGDIAGLSELCNAPNIRIKETKEKPKITYRLIDVGLGKTVLENKDHDHYIHVNLELNSKLK